MSTAATRIRNAIADRIRNLYGFNEPSLTGMPQLQPDDLPWSGIFISREIMTPDGEGNVGEPHFVSDVTIAMSIVRGFEDPCVLDGKIDEDIDAVEQALLSDPTFVGFGPDALFESVERIERRRQFPLSGETYFCELRLEITFRTRMDYPPLVADDYLGATVSARPLLNPDAPLITAHWDEPNT